MEPSTLALAAITVTAAIGLANLAQNWQLHRQGARIQVNVDGKMEAAIARTEVAIAEVAALKLLVAAQDEDRTGPKSEAVQQATIDVASAAATTEATP